MDNEFVSGGYIDDKNLVFFNHKEKILINDDITKLLQSIDFVNTKLLKLDLNKTE